MAKKKKKIYLLLAGGSSLIDKNANVWTVKSREDIAGWLAQMPELSILADLETIFISGEDDLVSADTWKLVAQEIDKYFLQADGFVVVSKIDQLINSALAVNFLLQNYKKSIIFTSSQISGSSFIDKKEIIGRLKSRHGGLGLRANLINALQIADQPMPGVAIVFGSLVIPAAKAIEDFSDEINVFKSIDNSYWGKVDFGLNLKYGLSYSKPDTRIFGSISSNILVLDDVPGISYFLDNDIRNYQGVLIKTGPYQALSADKQKQIAKWKKPVLAYNYLSSPKINYALSISNCTFNAALIKFMWYLSNTQKLGAYEEVMRQNVIGEFNPFK